SGSHFSNIRAIHPHQNTIFSALRFYVDISGTFGGEVFCGLRRHITCDCVGFLHVITSSCESSHQRTPSPAEKLPDLLWRKSAPPVASDASAGPGDQSMKCNNRRALHTLWKGAARSRLQYLRALRRCSTRVSQSRKLILRLWCRKTLHMDHPPQLGNSPDVR